MDIIFLVFCLILFAEIASDDFYDQIENLEDEWYLYMNLIDLYREKLDNAFRLVITHDKNIVYNKIKDCIPVSSVTVDNDVVTLNCGKYNDVEVIIKLQFVWNKYNLVEIKPF